MAAPTRRSRWTCSTPPTGFLNAGDQTTDAYVELSDAAKAARDPDERAAALQAMEGEVVEQAFTIPLAHDFNINAYSEQVQGFNLLAGGEMDFRNMSVSELTEAAARGPAARLTARR